MGGRVDDHRHLQLDEPRALKFVQKGMILTGSCPNDVWTSLQNAGKRLPAVFRDGQARRIAPWRPFSSLSRSLTTSSQPALRQREGLETAASAGPGRSSTIAVLAEANVPAVIRGSVRRRARPDNITEARPAPTKADQLVAPGDETLPEP